MKPFIKEKIVLRFFLVLVCLRLEEVVPLRIIHQAVPTPKIDFVLEIVTKKNQRFQMIWSQSMMFSCLQKQRLVSLKTYSEISMKKALPASKI